MSPLVLLPGLDGTGLLFDPLRALAPDAACCRYPDQPLGYDALEQHIRTQLPATPFVLLAESFSGPIGIRIAADPPPGLQALVLVASFVRAPIPLPMTWMTQVACPVLYLQATQDRLVPRAAADLLDAPNLTIQTIDGPHLLCQRRPAEVLTAIRHWRGGAPGR